MQKFFLLAALVAVVAARNYGGSSSGGFGRSSGGFKTAAAPQPIQQQYEESPSYATAGGARGGARAPARQQEDYHEPAPEPYSFTYETTDEYGVTLTRTESGDAQGNVKGSYMYRDANGIYRTVEYGDNGNGFQASVQSNEPGLISHKAADAEYIVQN